MSVQNEREAALERWVHATLRAQPLLPAPPALEARVRAALERRAVRPWWRGNFFGWPAPARTVFVLACAAGVKFGVEAVMWLTVNLHLTRLLAAPLDWVRTAGQVLESIAAAGAYAIGSLPPLWLYAGVGAGAVAYVAFFGLGAVLYRTLYK